MIKKQASHKDTSEHKWQYLINKRKYTHEKHFDDPNVFIVKNLNNINSLFKNTEDDEPKIIPKKLVIYVKYLTHLNLLESQTIAFAWKKN